MHILLSSVVSYLIGSISPSYFLGKILRGIDIRHYGDGNAGTINAIAVLGIIPGLITGLFDLTKGLIVFYIAVQFFNLEKYFIMIPVFSAIIGHIFPFYLKFRGGQGAATATGVLLYLIGVMIYQQRIPLEVLLILGIIVITLTYVARIGEFIGLIVLPILFYTILFYGGKEFPSLFAASLVVFLLGVNIYNIIRKRMYVIHPDIEIKWWRVWIRPAAVLFIVLYLIFGKTTILLIVGMVTLVFLIADVSRLVHRDVNRVLVKNLKYIFKKSEAKKFSSMTFFLIASFAVLLIFPPDIAFLSLSFLIFGDLFSKIFGLRFGKKKLIGRRTLEGTLSYFTGSLASGYIISTILGIDLVIVFAGAITAALAELFSLGLDDNFSVGIISSVVMFAFKYFKTL